MYKRQNEPSYRVGSLVPAILNASDIRAASCVNSNLSLLETVPTVNWNGLPVVEGPDSLPATLGTNVCPTLYPKPPLDTVTSLMKPTLVTVYWNPEPLPPTSP